MTIVKPKPKLSHFEIITNAINAMSQSELEVKRTYNRCQARKMRARCQAWENTRRVPSAGKCASGTKRGKTYRSEVKSRLVLVLLALNGLYREADRNIGFDSQSSQPTTVQPIKFMDPQ